ncbi:MAG: hypothetical protein GYA36_17445, partial [Veillonellaceae bacterium]|nr:hypothetical protein [Veillonellaceae bacterium]
TWRQLTKAHPQIYTATCLTGGGGTHLYFKMPEIKFGNSQLGNGVDIRGMNGTVVVPPSIHTSGNTYTWKYAPWEVPPAEIPDWLMQLLQRGRTNPEWSLLGDKLINGQRNNTMYHHALQLARQGANKEFILHTLETWRNKMDLSFDLNELNTIVDSALKKVSEDKSLFAQPIHRTDSDNADRLVADHHHIIKYAPGVGWLVWDGKTWVVDDETAMIINLATQTMTQVRDNALEAAKDPSTFKEAMAIAAWATASLNLSKLTAMTRLASTRSAVRISTEELDNHKTIYFLNTPAGVVDLRTGKINPHDATLNITKITRVAPAAGDCPFWRRTLELAFDGNTALIDYMQRAIGYTLSGSTREQCLFLCWGEQGNNGKSTILETLQWLLGGYAQMSDMKVITSPDMDNRVSSSLAKLMGTRCVCMNEAEEHQRLSEALIKQLTGGDTIQACKKFHEPFEFTPQFKLWIRSNEKPVIHGVSEAIWRRIKLIPFIKPIPAEARINRDEVDERLRAEAGQILTWCIEGAKWWYKSGLMDPAEVKTATQDYRTDMDIVQLFFDECVIEGLNKMISRINLYQAFAYWCREQGIKYVMSADAFGKRVGRRLGIRERIKVNGQYVWTGVDLTDHAKGYII